MRETTLPTDPPPDAPLVSDTYRDELADVAADAHDETGPQPTVQEIEKVLTDLDAPDDADPDTTRPDTEQEDETDE